MKVFSPLVLSSKKIVPITEEPSQTQQNTEIVPLQSPTHNTPSSKSLKMKKILSVAAFAAARTKSRLNVLVSPSDNPKPDTESANTRKTQHFWKQNAAKLEEGFDINSLSALDGSEKSQNVQGSHRKGRSSSKKKMSIDLTESASDPVKRRRKTSMEAKHPSPSLFSANKFQRRKMSLEDSPTRKMSFDLGNIRNKTPEKIGSAQPPRQNCLFGLVHEDVRDNPEQKKAQGDPIRGMINHNLLLSPNTTDSALTKEGNNSELERIPLRHTHTVDLDNPQTKEEEIFNLESEHSDSSYVDSLIEENPYDEFDESDHENNRLKKKSLNLRVFHHQKLCERLPRDSDFHDTKYLLFPDDPWKRRWDIISAFALLYVAIIMPVRLAFADDSTAWEVLDWIIDAIFLGDIIVTFFSAYLDSSYHLITDRKKIAWHYIKGWLIVDIVCILPVEYFTPHAGSNVKYNQLLKLARIPRLYRLIRVVKLIKMFKVMKDETQFEQHMDKSEDYLTPIIFRFAFACCTILLLCHISGCIWYLLVSLNESELSWPKLYELDEASKVDQYVASFYFVVQTAVTVGFGDMNPVLPEERLIACFFMVICVLIYSIFTGFLASMISDVDKHNEKYSEKLGILESIKKEYKLSLSFTKQLITSIKYQNKQKMDYSNFLNGLPTQLAVDLSYYMFKEIMENIPFFQGRTKSFMSSIGPLLKPMKIMKNEYIFMQGDPADELFFIKKGKVALVLKEYKNFEFIKINEGYFFGEVDLLFYGEIRQYTARAIKDCEFYVLNKKDFKKIFLVDFRDIGAEMYDNGHERKVRTRRIYKEAVQACKQHENPNKDDFNLKGKNKIRLLMNPRTTNNDSETESSSSEDDHAKFDLLAKIQEEDEHELDHHDILGFDPDNLDHHEEEPKDPVGPIDLDNPHRRRNSAFKNRFKAVKALLGMKKNNLGDVLEARRASVLGDPFEDEHRALEKLEADKQVNNLKDKMESLEEQLNQVVTLTKQLSRQLTRSASNVSSSPNKNLTNNCTFLSPNRINLDSERLRVRDGSNSILPQTPVSNKNESGVFSRFMNQSPRDFALHKSDGEDATPVSSANQ